jgi:hypothetical protein
MTDEEPKPIARMSDREVADWFAARMHDWFAELHAKGIEVPVDVAFGSGAIAGVLMRLTGACSSCGCALPYELGRKDERSALRAELLTAARLVDAAATPRADLVALLEGLANRGRT